jgi:hypothetical protein
VDRWKEQATTHGLFNRPFYKVWVAMLERCYKEDHAQYDDYGGRGIKVCDRWLSSYDAFESDMGTRPSGLSLDRIDNDKGYFPENCHWATQVQQIRNRRNTRFLVHNGKRLTVSEWAELTGLSYQIIMGRLRLGWSVKETLTTPSLKTGKYSRLRRTSLPC